MKNDIKMIEAGEHVKNSYMPYAVSTIVDRALPDVRDGFKPIARRILFSSYKAGIVYNKDRAKTVEPVSETMKIHHHGNTSVEDAIALMTEQNESLLHPYIDGEGAFGKVYSKDSPSPPRYTYYRLNKFSEEFFIDYKKDILHMIGEDKEHMQPAVLSASFPNILIKNNSGIACGESCDFPSFNLKEVCTLTQEYIKDKNISVSDYLIAPDFSSKGYLIYDKNALENIYNTGRGSFVLRAKYKYDNENQCIDIIEIPYTTTVNAIVSKISDLMKKSNLSIIKNITDVRDETGFNQKTQKEEMKITIDIKRNTDIKKLMAILYSKTPLESTFSVNMNCLVDYQPKVLGIKKILDYWLDYREDCVLKGIHKDIDIKSEKLEYLKALEKILLNTDEVIKIIRNSKKSEINESISKYFKIDIKQSERIANIKLNNINEEHILEQIQNISNLEQELKDLNDILNSKTKINEIIISELERIKNTYGKSRMTEIIYEDGIEQVSETDLIQDHSTYVILTKENYLKKLLKKTTDVKLKEGDEIIYQTPSSNKSTLLLFSNLGTCYKIYSHTLDECKPSSLGEYLPNLLNLQEGERIISMISTRKYTGYLINSFANGKIAKVDLASFKTKTMRSKLDNALNTDSELIIMIQIENDIDLLCKSTLNKVLIINTKDINAKSSKNTCGVQVLKSKKDSYMDMCTQLTNIKGIEDIEYYKGSPNSVGCYLKKTDTIIVD